jgi:uncharacterized repeat protein (TIGR02543 family)
MKKTVLLLLCSLGAMACWAQGTFKWPAYSPNVRYNFKELNPTFPEPTKVLNDCPQVVGEVSDRWFVFRWGPKRRKDISDLAVTNLLARMNTDFAYFRDVMGWPTDKRARNGYRSAVYLYGSGLCTDNADSTATGGWQSAIQYNGSSWAMVLASYVPIRAFDPAYNDEYQKGAMVHEGIHAVLADMPGVKQSAWFQEGGNVWLQQTADARRKGDFSSMGFLNATDFMAPFMPIECYSGWLVDGTFGGPSAEGVNKYNSSGTQICTWRTTLGGHQYSSMFPTALAQILGDGSIAWIWVNCPGRVLEGLGGGIGDVQMRRVITEYRSKMALLDLGEWTTASLALINGQFGQNIGVESQPAYMTPPLWKVTPYAKTTRNGNTLTPDTLTLPGWSGSNQIPLTVTGNQVTVNFNPIGANMTCQLAYRTTKGVPVYSQYVSSGNCTLTLTDPPASNVVIAVITSTDYVYKGEATRTAKYKYTLDLVTGVTGPADVNTKWYQSATLDNLKTVTFAATVVGGVGGSVSPEASGYLIGDTAIVTAYPLAGYTFAGWGGDATGTTNPIKIVMNANKAVTATFSAGPQYKLTNTIVGSGSVTPATGNYAQNSVQSLTAIPAAGYIFSGWSGDVTGTSNPISLTMSSNKNVTATFTPIPTQTFTYNVVMKPMTDYTATTVTLGAAAIAQYFGLTTAQVTSGFGTTIKYFAINKDGSMDSVSTANAPGHWFDKTGTTVTYGNTAFVFSELTISNLTAKIGQYPNLAVNGDTLTIKQALVYRKSASDMKQVVLLFKIKISTTVTDVDILSLSHAATTIYPNPSKSTFTLNNLEVSDVDLYAMDGRLLTSYKAIASLEFGAELQPGVYVIKAGKSVLRIIKE